MDNGSNINNPLGWQVFGEPGGLMLGQ